LRGPADPLQFEILDVVRRDLIEEAVALIVQRASVGQPVLRFFVGIQDTLEWNLLR
jgi:hypothetical protein